jgi:hypothetical protein
MAATQTGLAWLPGDLALRENPVSGKRSKRIDLWYHFICGCVENGSICTEFVKSKDKPTEILTKA